MTGASQLERIEDARSSLERAQINRLKKIDAGNAQLSTTLLEHKVLALAFFTKNERGDSIKKFDNASPWPNNALKFGLGT
jgi:hypothetical protein